MFTTLAALAQVNAEDSAALQNVDTTTLMQSLLKGKGSGQARYFFMATDNREPLPGYHAHAAGLHAKYETATYKKFSAGIAAGAVVNLHSSDFSDPDAATGQTSRYEAALFDITKPEKNSAARINELYVQYHMRSGSLKMGRQLLNTPFINPQDGRMNTTAVEALWADLGTGENKIYGGLITGISPRSTYQWYTVAESMGIYPQGVNTDGSPSAYDKQLSSKGIALVGFSKTFSPALKLGGWNQFVENIFNTSMLQINATVKSGQSNMLGSIQFTHQQKVIKGGNAEIQKTYFQHKASNVLSAMSGWQMQGWDVSLNYTRIFKTGRFLMPREWGREPFFTFLPRERNEGLGDVNAYVIKAGYTIAKTGIAASVQAGHFQLPDVNDAALNKYRMPSYRQLNASFRYASHLLNKGLDIQLLYVLKKSAAAFPENNSFVFNKVDMSLYNVIVNFSF
ncbi:MAG: hypothetical protein ACO1OO_16100 [Flavisolibacter sp.]